MHHADSRDEADKLYTGLSAGGNQTIPMNDTFWGSYFGINWMVSLEKKQ